MAGTLLNFASSEVSLKYREPFISEGLNLKSQGAIASGIKRGFYLFAPGAGNQTLGIAKDTVSEDNVAVVETTSGHSIHVLKSGDFFVNMSSLAGQTVVVAIYASYAVGAVTTATLRYYTIAEYEAAPEKDSLVVLGTVDVPGTAVPFTDDQVTHDRKTHAWTRIPPEEVPWVQVVGNSKFDQGRHDEPDDPTSIAGWTNSSGLFKQWYGGGALGQGAVRVEIASSPATGILEQVINLPVELGTKIRVKTVLFTHIAPTVAPLTNLELLWDENGTPLTTTSIPLVTVGSVSAGFETIDQIIDCPTTVGTKATLTKVRVNMAAQTWASTGLVLTLDGIQIFRARTSHEDVTEAAPAVVTSKLALITEDPSERVVNVESTTNDAGDRSIGLERLVVTENLETSSTNVEAPSHTVLVNTGVADRIPITHHKDATGEDYRTYAIPEGSLEQVSNAAWDDGTSEWTHDVAGQPASRVRSGARGEERFSVSSRWAFVDPTFADSEWKPILKVNDPHLYSSNLPALQVGTRGDYNRNIVDRFGLPFSRITEFTENWMGAAVDSNIWDDTGVFGAASITLNDYAPMLCPVLELDIGGGGSDVAEVLTHRTPFYLDLSAPILHAMEWEVEFSATAIDDLTFRMGFWTPGGDGIAAEFNPAANANWGIYTGDGLTITHDYSAVAVAVDEIYRVKLEVIGSGTGHGGPFVKLFINGALAVEKTASLPTISWCPIGTRLEDTDPGAVGGAARISPIKAVSIRTLSDDNV